MNERKHKEPKRGTVSLVLLSISMIIFGSLGLLFLTQMEITSGWGFIKYDQEYNVDLNAEKYVDVNDDGVSEVLFYGFQEYESQRDIKYDTPEIGIIGILNGKTGEVIWDEQYDKPIINAFVIGDVDKDDYDDIFICQASVEEEWQDADDEYGYIEFKENEFDNHILSGKNGEEIDLEDSSPFSEAMVYDLIDLGDYKDDIEDLITLEMLYDKEIDGEKTYNMTLNGYYINGTLKQHLIWTETSRGYEIKESNWGLEKFSYG